MMKKLWGIRHIRYFYLKVRVFQAAEDWARMGIGFGYPNEYDIQMLQSIWDGKK